MGASWKLVLGVVFVLLVFFLRRGIVGGVSDLVALALASARAPRDAAPAGGDGFARVRGSSPGFGSARAAGARGRARDRRPDPRGQGPVEACTAGSLANSEIDFTVERGELRGVIGPNGAGKSTFFKMLTCEINPTSGSIHFEGRDITDLGVTEVCQLGLTKSYQVNQLFTA